MKSVNRTKIDGTKKEVSRPNTVVVYTDILGRADRFDLRKERPQIRIFVKGWHHILHFLMDLDIINSLILWQVNNRNRSLNQITFHTSLARQLMDGYSSRKWKGRSTSFKAKMYEVPEDVRLASVGNHLPKILPNCRRCWKCSRK
ncbi:piggyBac transposable element-derived protein 4 [Trichonephila clavipes]|nr:piggyBac transposable element-derived protein 4 [Trichonephila clavipes]